MSRFSRYLFCALILSMVSVSMASADSERRAAMESFVGTDLHYRIGFLWMDHVADGSLVVERDAEPGVYRARLIGKTRGAAAWLTSDRAQSYETRMLSLPDGRLQTISHESLIDKGKGKGRKTRSKFYRFDAHAGVVEIEKRGDGQVMWRKKVEVAAETFPVDVLTAFFNFATGVYGPFEIGRRYEVPAFSGEGVGLIRITVIDTTEAPGSLFSDDALLCRVEVDQEVFDTRDGILYVQFDRAMRPVRGLIEDIIGLGDIRGELR